MEQQNESSESNFDQFSLFLMNSNPNLILPIVSADNSTNSHSHQLVSTNSFELNAPTSLSEDSGIPHTNSSISSGDSFRIGLCKFELELGASDGEDSQFDSLDNCSDGGMSAENFNTLKKVPLAPIDPPPEFQDSPQTTLLRSPALQTYAVKITRALIMSALKLYSIQYIPNEAQHFNIEVADDSIQRRNCFSKKLSSSRSYDMYASDSLLHEHIDNIYDVPNSESDHGSDLENPSQSLHVKSIVANHSEKNSNHRFGLSKVCEIYDYDIYYKRKENQPETVVQRKKTPILYSPLHYHPATGSGNRPNSRNSLNSRLSSSHNSLTVPTTNKADDSIFITQAMSHDALTGREIADFYNVPIDSDIYSLPIDVIHQQPEAKNSGYKNLRGKLKYVRNKDNKKRRKINTNGDITANDKYKLKTSKSSEKRHSVPENAIEPMHMTLDEVKRFYHSLYSSSSDSSEIVSRKWPLNNKTSLININNNNNNNNSNNNNNNCNIGKIDKNNFSTINHTNLISSVKLTAAVGGNHSKSGNNLKNKKSTTKDECANNHSNYHANQQHHNHHPQQQPPQQQQQQQPKFGINTTSKKPQFSISWNLKQKFCSIFRFRKTNNNNQHNDVNQYESGRLTSSDIHNNATTNDKKDKKIKFSTRALPPLPAKSPGPNVAPVTSPEPLDDITERPKEEKTAMDFATNIEKVKEYGWYWGPISSEAAEKILSNEPDGSFIVRDSSDDHYIFSLTFKLNNSVRHVRIEQDQGTFSFGSCAKFKSNTIMEFIENAVESSRSGRYLFFFHRRPEHGPMRVQLTNPVSRFKHIQSLQHMCRFVIRKAVVRKDLIQSLPLPRRLLDYISYKNCYSEQVESDSSQSQLSGDGQVS